MKFTITFDPWWRLMKDDEGWWRYDWFQVVLKICTCRNICIIKKFWWNWSLLKFQHQKVFSIFIKGIYWFSSFFHQNSFNKRGFYLKNLQNLWPKIFEASKILRHLKMNRRWRRRWIFGQKSSKLRRSSKLRCNTAL